VFPVIWIRSRECPFHTLDCSLCLLDKITALLGVYKLHNLAIKDCSSDSAPILIFVRKYHVILAEFLHIDGSARWLTSFNSNHTTPHAGTLPSTGRYWPTTQLLLCLSCAPEDKTFCLLSKTHIDCAATRNWPPPILEVDNRLLEECWRWIWRHTKNPMKHCNEKSPDLRTFQSFSTRRE